MSAFFQQIWFQLSPNIALSLVVIKVEVSATLFLTYDKSALDRQRHVTEYGFL